MNCLICCLQHCRVPARCLAVQRQIHPTQFIANPEQRLDAVLLTCLALANTEKGLDAKSLPSFESKVTSHLPQLTSKSEVLKLWFKAKITVASLQICYLTVCKSCQTSNVNIFSMMMKQTNVLSSVICTQWMYGVTLATHLLK